MYQPTQEHIDLWKRGWSCIKISKIAGVSKATVCRAMIRLGFDLKARPNPSVEKAIAAAKELRKQGMSMRSVADRIGYSDRQLTRWLNGTK